MSNNKQSMGDMQFNGTPEEWEVLVEENKMNNNKQSSIDWLYNKMCKHSGNITLEEYIQAKAMHKEEMLTAMDIAFRDGLYIADESYGESYKSPYDDWEDYYNKTFGGNNE